MKNNQRLLSMTRRQLKHCIKKGKLPQLLDQLFGKNQWSYDEKEQLYIVQDKHDVGMGTAYFCINQKGDWFKARLPVGVVQ